MLALDDFESRIAALERLLNPPTNRYLILFGDDDENEKRKAFIKQYRATPLGILRFDEEDRNC